MAYIIILALVIIIMSILNACGKAVGSGANVKDFFLVESEKKKEVQNMHKCQLSKTIAGLLFGMLLLCPILYRNRINGEPFINIDHQVRDYVVGFLGFAELLLFVLIWNADRKARK
ncbi:hypothetical protein [Geomonas edaphica]|uniref:hypothetical protein n=1 Tax=Geomonas edaphica TaxID=2570226 RepID=UPI0010A8AFE0|nr:hypothetical protein [Geomonas edaphica]